MTTQGRVVLLAGGDVARVGQVVDGDADGEGHALVAHASHANVQRDGTALSARGEAVEVREQPHGVVAHALRDPRRPAHARLAVGARQVQVGVAGFRAQDRQVDGDEVLVGVPLDAHVEELEFVLRDRAVHGHVGLDLLAQLLPAEGDRAV